MPIKNLLRLAAFSFLIIGCAKEEKTSINVITSDIDHFWMAFDSISNEQDSLRQLTILNDVFLSQGSPGLAGMMTAKNYTATDYVNMINTYPTFLQSVRANTTTAKNLSSELEGGIQKLKDLYPNLRPAKIYFTVGAMRSGGTTLDSMVLIGSELAMVDENSDISEFEGGMKNWAENYIATKPLDNIVLLNVHEYVHTQQHPIPSKLLYQCLYEGVAEFVSVKAMETTSSSPAIAYGKSNSDVKKVFEKEMFYDWTFQWLWSNAPNQFDTRDLGYSIGYDICELFYEAASDKNEAIKQLIELDYSDTKAIDDFVDKTGFFSQQIAELRKKDMFARPKVESIKQFKNHAQDVDPSLKELTLEFSEAMSTKNSGLDYGELGPKGFPKIKKVDWSSDARAWTINVDLKPNTSYEMVITNNFRTEAQVALYPFVLKFRTKG